MEKEELKTLAADYMETAEAAELLHIQPVTLRRWRAQGKVEAHKVGKKYLYSREAIAKLLDPKAAAKLLNQGKN